VPETDVLPEPEADFPDDGDDVRTDADITGPTPTAPVLSEDSTDSPNVDVRTETETTAAADGNVPLGADMDGSLPQVRVRPETDSDVAPGADVRTHADTADPPNRDVLPEADPRAIPEGDVRKQADITTTSAAPHVPTVADIERSLPPDGVRRATDTAAEIGSAAAEHVRPCEDMTTDLVSRLWLSCHRLILSPKASENGTSARSVRPCVTVGV
jgi:hypothetical protein